MKNNNMDIESYESPYCKHCEGCGEDGCCPAKFCTMQEGGLYCERYLKDLQFAYLMYHDLYDLIPKDKMDEIHDKNYKKIYE